MKKLIVVLGCFGAALWAVHWSLNADRKQATTTLYSGSTTRYRHSTTTNSFPTITIASWQNVSVGYRAAGSPAHGGFPTIAAANRPTSSLYAANDAPVHAQSSRAVQHSIGDGATGTSGAGTARGRNAGVQSSSDAVVYAQNLQPLYRIGGQAVSSRADDLLAEPPHDALWQGEDRPGGTGTGGSDKDHTSTIVPIGDGLWALALLCLLYIATLWVRRSSSPAANGMMNERALKGR